MIRISWKCWVIWAFYIRVIANIDYKYKLYEQYGECDEQDYLATLGDLGIPQTQE